MGKLSEILLQREKDVKAGNFPEETLRINDPIKWEILYTRLHGLVQNSRETAKNISASPIVREMGECIFAFFTPEGDSVCFSTGLLIHVGSIGSSIKWMIRNNYEELVGIKEGDYFFNNDAFVGGAHTCDQVTCTPVIVEGEVIGWAGGLTHVPETGAIEPGGGGAAAATRYDEGITWPCVKIAENDLVKRDLEIIVERGTRFSSWWILDNRARMAGARLIRDGVKDLVKEFGKDYFMAACYEYIENTRKVCSQKVKKVLFPGVYRGVTCYAIPNANLPVRYPEDHFLIIPLKMSVKASGEIFMDLEGASPPGYHPSNASYWGSQGMLSSMMIQTVYYDVKYNQGLYQASLEPRNLHIPPSVFNPPPVYGVNQWSPAQALAGVFSMTVGRAFWAGGFREESSSGSTAGTGLTWEGTDQFGRPGTGINFEAAVTGMDACGVTDGPPVCYSTFNPEGDCTDAEIWEKLIPLIYVSRRIQVDGGGFGKYRGGAGLHSLFVVENTTNLMVGGVGATGEAFITQGIMGGYPAATSYRQIYRDTNFFEIVAEGKDIPFFENDAAEHPFNKETLTGTLVRYPSQHPQVRVNRGDLITSFTLSGAGFGDPIDRKSEAVVQDLDWKLTSRRAAEKVYGVALNENGVVDEAKTAQVRADIREERKKRGIPAEDYIQQYREKLLKGNIPARPKKGLNNSLTVSERFRKEFVGFWGLPDDFTMIP
jgi:acetone carboxylase, alpha subunit